MEIRTLVAFESGISEFLSKIAQNDVKIIYFRKNGCFLSGFGKLNRFGYMGGNIAPFKIAYGGGSSMLSEREKAARCALFVSYCHTIPATRFITITNTAPIN